MDWLALFQVFVLGSTPLKLIYQCVSGREQTHAPWPLSSVLRGSCDLYIPDMTIP